MDLSVLDIQQAKKKQFAARGIYSVEDLLSYMPKRYKDYSKITGILPQDQISCIRVKVVTVESKNAGKMPYVAAACVESDTGKPIKVLWFHSQWMARQLREYINHIVVAIGKIEYSERYGNYSMIQPDVFDYDSCLGIYPVYKSVPGMSTEYFTGKMARALNVGLMESEILPRDILEREGELTMPVALRYVHSPKTLQEAEEGMNRILLNDLLYFSLHNELNKSSVSSGSQYNIKTSSLMNAVRASLPYELTADQASALKSMVDTAKEGRRLNALLQGDVGCGKTIVSALLAAAFIGSGYQVVIMAPTQVLARQHLTSMDELFLSHGIHIAYLDGSLSVKERKAAIASIKSGEAKLIVGTHACIRADVEYHNLALAIVDEEHKFGVKQRTAIVEKAAAGVHNVTMSATPIPRSLAQVIYGDNIQLYTIKTMPNGRKPIMTGIAKSHEKVLRFLKSEVGKGHQAYVVCPLIEANEKTSGVKSVEEVFQEYKDYFEPLGIHVGKLTGRNTKAETELTIEQFKEGSIHILVATTVIEVGVNVPNATVMVITNADRFGLSGLHQLRGRVGRGAEQSYCVLESESQDGKALARLNVLCNSTDGFEIAEEDLKLRGAGDFLGTQQSGDNKYVSLMLANPDRYQQAIRIAKELIDRGMDCCKLTEQVKQERENNGESESGQ